MSYVSRIISAAASTNATVAKASPGRLYGVKGHNASQSARWLKLYNKATSPVVGTDTPVETLYLPARATFALDWTGFYFTSGISYALTTGGADNDTGALASGDVLGLNIEFS